MLTHSATGEGRSGGTIHEEHRIHLFSAPYAALRENHVFQLKVPNTRFPYPLEQRVRLLFGGWGAGERGLAGNLHDHLVVGLAHLDTVAVSSGGVVHEHGVSACGVVENAIG